MAGPQLLALILVAIVTVSVSQETVQTATTHGESGVECGRSGRRCVTGSLCSAASCICPYGLSGDAQFQCANSTERVCFLNSDTRVYLTGFGGSGAAVNMPCSYRASRFITRQKDSYSYCGVEVHVTNARLGDSYRTRALHVSVGRTEHALQVQTNTETTVTGAAAAAANGSTAYHYQIRSGRVNVLTWGSSGPELEQRRHEDLIRHSVDDVDNFVNVDIPACDTRIRFRAFDSSHNSQAQLPGVAITVPDTAEWMQTIGDYPASLCGLPDDKATLYRDSARQEGLGAAAVSTIAAILQHRPPQFDNPDAAQCVSAMDLYASSRDPKADLKACHFLLTKKNTRSCLVDNGMTPISTFNACLMLRQVPNDAQACVSILQATAKCYKKWSGSSTYCQ